MLNATFYFSSHAMSSWRSVQQLSFHKAAGGIACNGAFCVKPGAGLLPWKFPAKSCDRLASGATHKSDSTDAVQRKKKL